MRSSEFSFYSVFGASDEFDPANENKSHRTQLNASRRLSGHHDFTSLIAALIEFLFSLRPFMMTAGRETTKGAYEKISNMAQTVAG